jgi:uncharacterized membrane protein affecting hemolysin expression
VKNADGTYTATQTTVIGSYLSFSADGPCTFKLQKATNSSMLIKLCVLLCLALALVVLVIIVSHAKRRRKKLEEQKAVKEAEVISEDDAENI